MVVSHPPERGAHDDYPDSWALAVYGCRDNVDNYKIQQENKNPFLVKQHNSYYKSINNRTARRR